MKRTLAIVLLTLAAMLVSGCEQPPRKVRLGGSDLRSPLVSPYETPALPKPPKEKARIDDKRLADYNQLLDDFEKRSEFAFERTDTQKHLPGIERFYVDTSRMFDLARIYRKAYDKYGAGHYVAPRLAWTYLYLNDIKNARKVIDVAKRAQPNNALVHFVEGSIFPREEQSELKIAVAVRDAWDKCLALEPNFQGPLGVTAQIIRARLKEIDTMIERAGGPKRSAPKPPTPPVPEPATDNNPTADKGNPKAADPDLLRGEALMAEGKFLDAAEAFRTVLTKDPKTLSDTVATQRRAQVGFALAAWRHPGKIDQTKAKLALELAAARPDLTRKELFELFEVYATKVLDPAASKILAERLTKMDPAFAKSKNLDGMMPK